MSSAAGNGHNTSPKKEHNQMAQRTIVVKTDDLEAQEGRSVDATDTVEFGLDGTNYEIDLSETNASALRNALGDYVKAARQSSRRTRRGGGSSSGGNARPAGASSTDREHNKEVRAFWAAIYAKDPQNVKAPSERGRIPKEVTGLYNETGGNADAYQPQEGATQPSSTTPISAPTAPPADSGVTQDEDGVWRDEEGFEVDAPQQFAGVNAG